jgi:Helicase conserved C-terminal domain
VGQLDLLDANVDDRHVQALPSLGREERDACSKLADEFLLVGKDSKWDELRVILEGLRSEPPQKAIIFTQWRPTLRHMREMAASIRDPKCFFLSGDDNDWQVENVLRGFSVYEGRAALFATDFLAEGIDLQCADTVVNYDFPYNPMRVEQRIGRVDRIGQQSEGIYIHNLWVEGSLDADILDILQTRLNVFEESMGDVTDILAIKPKGSSVELVSPQGWRAESLKEIDRFGLFSGVEDFLDREVEELHTRGSASFHSLQWLPVVKCLLVCTGGRARVISESDDSARVGPLLDEDIDVVAEWVGVRDAAFVRAELQSYRDGADRCVTIAKGPKADGLFVSPAHPLARVAAAVSMNSEGFTDHTKPIVMGAQEVPDDVVFFRYANQDNEMAVWKRSDHLGFSKVDRQAVSSLLRSIGDRKLSLRPYERGWSPPSDLIDAAEEDCKASRNKSVAESGEGEGWKAQAPTNRQGKIESCVEYIGAIIRTRDGGDLDGPD